ncbi:MAG: TIGR00296 family protein [Candidatus Heimdallarchaeota archaeon]|nr:TIGR00296 family protein [Candidatus Heimdallarchaeota archaeon]
MTDKELEYTIEDGKILVDLARRSIIHFLTFGKVIAVPNDIPKKLEKNAGVFVTLNKRNEMGGKGLRGCIGYVLPIYSLVKATIEAAKSAAVNDPRFAAIQLEELYDIEIEVTILTPPKKIIVNEPIEYLDKIAIGRDGLIVKNDGRSGLLLPQVPIEWEWTVEEFLEHTCQKAWLGKNCWKDPKTEIESFTGVIFHEIEPNGEVIKREIWE